MQTIYISNLPYTATEVELKSYFGVFGEIKAVKVVTDRETGRPRGIAFIEFSTVDSTNEAVQGTDKREFMGRILNVSLARPKGERPAPRAPREQPVYTETHSSYADTSINSWQDAGWQDSGWEKKSRRDRRENRRKFDR